MKKNKKREPIDDLIDLWCRIRRRSQQESRAAAASTIKAGKPGAPAPPAAVAKKYAVVESSPDGKTVCEDGPVAKSTHVRIARPDV